MNKKKRRRNKFEAFYQAGSLRKVFIEKIEGLDGKDYAQNLYEKCIEKHGLIEQPNM